MITEIFNGLSHGFRMAIPGLCTILLIKWSRPVLFADIQNFLNADVQMIGWGVLAFAAGMTAYGIHKNALFLLDFIFLFRIPFTAIEPHRTSDQQATWLRLFCHTLGPWATFLMTKYDDKSGDLAGYLGHRWSMAHSLCVIGELTIFFHCAAARESPLWVHGREVFWIGFAILLLGLISLALLHIAERRIHERLQGQRIA